MSLRILQWLAVLAIVWLHVAAAGAQAPALPCAILGTGSSERVETLCKGVGKELGRKTIVVDDGRSVPRGDALHIVQGDVVWTLVWLRDGEARAFTRVSAIDAAGKEILMLGRACRVLSREARQVTKECVRVEPNGGRKMRSPELAYPWVELKKCRAHPIDVADPWWTTQGS